MSEGNFVLWESSSLQRLRPMRCASLPTTPDVNAQRSSALQRRRRRSQTTCAALQDQCFVVSGFGKAEAPEDVVGELVRVEVGNVGERKRQTFVFPPVLRSPSQVLSVTLPRRPLGVVFVPDSAGRVRVSSFLANSDAGRAASVSKLSPGGAQAAQVGDVLRAVTATVFAFTPAANLVGDLTNTKRTVVLYGADGETYQSVFRALTQGLVADGPVTLVLERPLTESPDARWSPLPVKPTTEEEQQRLVLDASEQDEAEALERWRNEELAPEPLGSDVGSAIIVTAGLLALLIAAGFSP